MYPPGFTLPRVQRRTAIPISVRRMENKSCGEQGTFVPRDRGEIFNVKSAGYFVSFSARVRVSISGNAGVYEFMYVPKRIDRVFVCEAVSL